MNYRSIAAPVATCRQPLGRIADILVEGYLEEKRLVREAEAVKAETKDYRTIAQILSDNPEYTPERVAIARANWKALGDRLAAKHRTQPGKRCTEQVGRGRCRALSHRFATRALCPRHHAARKERMARAGWAKVAVIEGYLNWTYEQWSEFNPYYHDEAPRRYHLQCFRSWRKEVAAESPEWIEDLMYEYEIEG